MTLQDTVAADKSAVAIAQSALDAANTILAADEAKLAIAQVHLSLIDKIKAELVSVEDGLADQAKQAISNLQAKIMPVLDEMIAALSA